MMSSHAKGWQVRRAPLKLCLRLLTMSRAYLEHFWCVNEDACLQRESSLIDLLQDAVDDELTLEGMGKRVRRSIREMENGL